MKPVSTFLHRMPWWFVLLGGCALFIALVLYAIPFQIAELEHRGTTPEENRAIKSEINSAFSQSALDIARGVVQEMRDRTHDEDRRRELDQALEELDNAKEAMQEAGAEAIRAKREAADQVSEAVREAHRAIAQAQRQASRALKDAGPERQQVEKSLDDSLKSADDAERQARDAVKHKNNPPHAVA